MCAVIKTGVPHTDGITRENGELWNFVIDHPAEAETLCKLLEKSNESESIWTWGDYAKRCGGELAYCGCLSALITNASPHGCLFMWLIGNGVVGSLKGLGSVTSWLCTPTKGKRKREAAETGTRSGTLWVENKRLQTQASSVEAESTRLKQEVTGLKTKASSAEAENTRLKTKASSAEAEKARLGQKVTGLEQQLAQQKEVNKVLAKQLDTLANQ
jgi:hypothetical protein